MCRTFQKSRQRESYALPSHPVTCLPRVCFGPFGSNVLISLWSGWWVSDPFFMALTAWSDKSKRGPHLFQLPLKN